MRTSTLSRNSRQHLFCCRPAQQGLIAGGAAAGNLLLLNNRNRRLTSTETVGLLGTGAQDGHLDFHTAPELWVVKLKCCFTSTETVGLLGTGAQDGHRDFTQLLSSVQLLAVGWINIHHRDLLTRRCSHAQDRMASHSLGRPIVLARR